MNTPNLVLYALCNALMVTAVIYEVRGSSIITLSHEPDQPEIESMGKIFLTLHGSGVGSHYNAVVEKSSQQPLTNVVTEEIFSPEEVMPHPKAPRKQNLRGRKSRHTAILTDSPKRDAVYEGEKKREERKQKKVDRLSQKSKKMRKVYAQDKKVVKEKIQGERQRRRLTEL